MKKSTIIMIGIIVLILLVLVGGFIYYFRTFPLSEQNDFQKVLNEKTAIEDIKLEVYSISQNNSFAVDNQDDMLLLLNQIKDAKIQNTLDEDLLGGYARFIITNNKTNESVKVNIGATQISINGKNYQAKDNYLTAIKELYLKYNTDGIV